MLQRADLICTDALVHNPYEPSLWAASLDAARGLGLGLGLGLSETEYRYQQVKRVLPHVRTARPEDRVPRPRPAQPRPCTVDRRPAKIIIGALLIIGWLVALILLLAMRSRSSTPTSQPATRSSCWSSP